MYIIKLDAIDSTNAYLKAMDSVNLPKDFTVVIAEHQSNGRGQMGANWQTEKGKNLTVSVFKNLKGFKIENQFYISMAVSLAILKTLKSFNMPRLYIKWPNDILSADKKLCGILIENVIKNNQLQGSVIGFGLNVNQNQFYNLPKASSMQIITGIVYNKEEVLSKVLNTLKYYFKLLASYEYDTIKTEYESYLFRKNKPSTFITKNGMQFSGIIKGVANNGKLKIWTENDVVNTYDLKELSLLY
ncbi:biotin--[acetyl-CoA-carboxylase] ligase [uncultured Winogradskyella sp.]|uniref:biotin--[acetyl-CoA-carboxylase] ligase n=1 Tax=uncultured Winogradskyella sp. TaxID=395353 RepID=UPI00263574EC|nr:biotin--[acetyl-CoA-carboxylase] ligase [uncultured Winogradskyella sp.]